MEAEVGRFLRSLPFKINHPQFLPDDFKTEFGVSLLKLTSVGNIHVMQ